MVVGLPFKSDDMDESIIKKAVQIKLLVTDVDGVLTDNGVYYSPDGELMKKFSIRDGMGVERLRNLCGIETGFITGEKSPSVIQRAQKLGIKEVNVYIKDKAKCMLEIMQRNNLQPNEIAYIGDDVNDLDAMKMAGLSACPQDAMDQVKNMVDYTCENKGGQGAFRELAEFLISSRLEHRESSQTDDLVNTFKFLTP